MGLGFVIQVLLAGVATARGWGFIPWLILGAVFLTGLTAGQFVTYRNVDSWVMFLLLVDGATMITLAVLAFVGRSNQTQPTY